MLLHSHGLRTWRWHEAQRPQWLWEKPALHLGCQVALECGTFIGSRTYAKGDAKRTVNSTTYRRKATPPCVWRCRATDMLDTP